jgi:hypothetical protein
MFSQSLIAAVALASFAVMTASEAKAHNPWHSGGVTVVSPGGAVAVSVGHGAVGVSTGHFAFNTHHDFDPDVTFFSLQPGFNHTFYHYSFQPSFGGAVYHYRVHPGVDRVYYHSFHPHWHR